MIIRKAKISDLSELAKIFDDYRVFYKKESDVESARKFLSERIEKNESEILIAVTEIGRLAGFLQLYPIFSSTRMKRLWLLNDLFVDPDFRRKGISIALIEQAKTLCKNTGSCGMILETAKSNLEGNNLYPKTGFNLNQDHNYYEWENQSFC